MEKVYRKGVIAVVIDNANNFLIANLQSYNEGEWNLIGGGIDGDETPEEAVIREVSEEIGLV